MLPDASVPIGPPREAEDQDYILPTNRIRYCSDEAPDDEIGIGARCIRHLPFDRVPVVVRI